MQLPCRIPDTCPKFPGGRIHSASIGRVFVAPSACGRAERTIRISALLAMILTLCMWGLSYFRAGYFGKHHIVTLRAGGLDYGHFQSATTDLADEGRWYLSHFQGFTTLWTTHYIGPQRIGWWSVFIPLWMPTVFFALILGLSFLPFRRR